MIFCSWSTNCKYTVLVLLDIVEHIMANRLETKLKCFDSYLSEMSFKVVANQIFSETALLTCGVPQGSALVPILFLLPLFILFHPLGLITIQ